MNFNIGGPSNINIESSSSSPSPTPSPPSYSSYGEFDNELFMQSLDHDEAVAQLVLQNINRIMEYYQNRLPNQSSHHCGSVPGHRMINRDREAPNLNLVNDYFSANPRYNDEIFRRRYRMSRTLFIRIVDAIKVHDEYFQQRRDGFGRLRLSTLQKTTIVFRMLAYDVAADATDEYVKIGESTTIESLKRFCRAVVEVFSERYLRSSNANDITRLLHIGQTRGFPGMLGSLDCMHWKWKNCPTAWAGQYAGRSGSPTIILEAMVDYGLWIWHAYFGMPDTNNDINVLESSHLFSNLAQGIAPPAHYVIQGKQYNMRYYLADGIYPKWSTLVQSIQQPRGRKKQHFARKQKSCRKDVERAFGVLQSRFAMVAGLVRFWSKDVLHDIMTACIIMHNMIIEDERDLNTPIRDALETPAPMVDPPDEHLRFQQFLGRYRQIQNRDAHIELRNALIEHLWEELDNAQDNSE